MWRHEWYYRHDASFNTKVDFVKKELQKRRAVQWQKRMVTRNASAALIASGPFTEKEYMQAERRALAVAAIVDSAMARRAARFTGFKPKQLRDFWLDEIHEKLGSWLEIKKLQPVAVRVHTEGRFEVYVPDAKVVKRLGLAGTIRYTVRADGLFHETRDWQGQEQHQRFENPSRGITVLAVARRRETTLEEGYLAVAEPAPIMGGVRALSGDHPPWSADRAWLKVFATLVATAMGMLAGVRMLLRRTVAAPELEEPQGEPEPAEQGLAEPEPVFYDVDEPRPPLPSPLAPPRPLQPDAGPAPVLFSQWGRPAQPPTQPQPPPAPPQVQQPTASPAQHPILFGYDAQTAPHQWIPVGPEASAARRVDTAVHGSGAARLLTMPPHPAPNPPYTAPVLPEPPGGWKTFRSHPSSAGRKWGATQERQKDRMCTYAISSCPQCGSRSKSTHGSNSHYVRVKCGSCGLLLDRQLTLWE